MNGRSFRNIIQRVPHASALQSYYRRRKTRVNSSKRAFYLSSNFSIHPVTHQSSATSKSYTHTPVCTISPHPTYIPFIFLILYSYGGLHFLHCGHHLFVSLSSRETNVSQGGRPFTNSLPPTSNFHSISRHH